MIYLKGKVLQRIEIIDEPIPDKSHISAGLLAKLRESRARRKAEGLDRETVYLVVSGMGAGHWVSTFIPHCVVDSPDTQSIMEAMQREYPDAVVKDVVIQEVP